MSAISTINSGELNYHNLGFQNNDDSMMRNIDFKNDSLDDNLSTNMDGKRMRKAVFRRTIDYNSSVALFIEQRTWKRRCSGRSAIQPDIMYQHLLTPPTDYRDNPMNCVCAKHVRTSTNKNKCPIYAVCWTPDGRRLITGASSGEFTLWNGLTFNFETILQAHDTHIRAMKWSNNEEWLVSADDSGFVKYWQANMNDVNVFQAHKDSVRGVSFCPSDKKFVTCSNDNTVRIWDFHTYKEERVLRGHGGEVRCVAWHPTKSLLLSGSKDSQQPLKLWDPKAGECISTMYVHKSTCTDIGINKNGNWFLTASKDHYIKLFDLRNLKSEMQVFRGHKKDVIRVAWHPYHETLFASGSGDGALLYWLVGTDMEVGAVEDAHDNIIWSLDWHPMGHILASGSNDFATKFWTRNRPGDVLKDNLQEEKLSALKQEASHPAQTTDTLELDSVMKLSSSAATGASDSTEKVFDIDIHRIKAELEKSDIPGLSEGLNGTGPDQDSLSLEDDTEDRESKLKGGSVSRTIPKQFQSNWANKKSIPAVYVTATEAGAAGLVFAPVVVPPPVVPQQPPLLPPNAITPIIALPPPPTSTAGQIRPGMFPAGRLPPPPSLAHDLMAHATSLNPPHSFPQDDPSKQPPSLNPPQPIIDENPAFRMMRPPMNTAPSRQNFRPRNAIIQPQPLMRGSGGDSLPPPQQQHHHQQQPPPPFRGPFPNEYDFHHGGPPHHNQHPHHNNNNNNNHNQIHNNMNNNINNMNQQNFPPPSSSSHGEFGHQNRHMMRPPFRPDFMPDEPPQNQNRGDFNRHHPGNRPILNANRRGGRFPSPAPQHQQRHHNHRHNQQHHQQQQYRGDDNENPFEPSKSTGSSKTFIPLSQKHDDQQKNNNNRNINKNRMGNRPGNHW